MKKFSYEIISGIPPEHIEEYLKMICDRNIGNTEYYGNGWEIILSYQEPRVFSKISIPVTKILFIGDEMECQSIIKDFRMKFLSAGG